MARLVVAMARLVVAMAWLVVAMARLVVAMARLVVAMARLVVAKRSQTRNVSVSMVRTVGTVYMALVHHCELANHR